jgi:DNA polymerase IV
MDKAAYFEALYSLDEDSDDDGIRTPIQDIAISIPSSFASSPVEETAPLPLAAKATPALERSLSAPTPGSAAINVIKGTPLISFTDRLRPRNTGTPLSNEVSFVEETPTNSAALQNPRRSPVRTTSAPLPALNRSLSLQYPIASTLGKRKRKEPSIKLVPEEQRVLKDLVFFCIPPDDVAPVRRARIVKAREHGAIWTTEWNESITYIVAEKDLSYQDIISFLKISSIPSHMTLVTELYLLDCIQFKAILNPNQKQYLVKGHEAAQEQVVVEPLLRPAASQTSDHSLQLKASKSKPGRWNYVPPKATPPRSESPSQRIHVDVGPNQALDNLDVSLLLEEAPVFGTMDNEDDTTVSLHQPLLAAESAKVISTVSGPTDTLDELINEARTVQHLPLDEEDDDDRPSSASSLDKLDNSGTDRCHTRNHKSSFMKRKFNQESFSCMKGGTAQVDSSSPNAGTIAILQEMADYYTRMDDTWRPMAYRKAITTLKSHSTRISTAAEAAKLPNVGKRLADKIEEIALTSRLRRLDNTKTEPGDQILQLFLGIYGVGISQASSWLSQGYTTLDDLLAHANLTENQRLGIVHYEDFQTRIPRQEVSALGKIIETTARRIDGEVRITIGGSYRRGAETCGDIDILVTKPGTSSCSELSPFLRDLVAELRNSGLLVAALAVGRTEQSSKWHGCCVLPSLPVEQRVWRRIDFHLAPASELGAALIYFTGNEIFNRSIRLLASKRGMRLNQRGLYRDVMRGPGRVKLNEGELVEGADERKIFAALGVPWRGPEERIC